MARVLSLKNLIRNLPFEYIFDVILLHHQILYATLSYFACSLDHIIFYNNWENSSTLIGHVLCTMRVITKMT